MIIHERVCFGQEDFAQVFNLHNIIPTAEIILPRKRIATKQMEGV
jgi:hypothetical protein